MQTQLGGDRRCGIGARLRTARERTGMTPLQAAERLHMDPHVIDALETETFELLGPPVYVRGHLKRYAELVGEPPAELQQDYAASAQASELPDLTRIPKRAHADQRRVLVRTGTAIVGGIALIGASWWAARVIRNTAVPIAESVIGPPPVVSDVGDRPAAPATATAAAPAIAKVGDVPDAAPAPVATQPARPAPAMSTLTLRFTADSWAEVYDTTGKRLFYDVGSADTTHTLRGAAPLRVVLGNPSGVSVEFNGRPAAIPEFAVRDGQARFVVNRSGRIVRSRIAAGGVAQ